MKLTIVMDNGTRYNVNEGITDKYSRVDINKVLRELGLFTTYESNTIRFVPLGLEDGNTDVYIRLDRIQSYEYKI